MAEIKRRILDDPDRTAIRTLDLQSAPSELNGNQ